ncbi:MAG: hypothetical protein GQ540_07475 [Lutibacter sp.]|uniref:hypothetical protein n=1 Tax=Lutibacter sp. TaxID=1925666 RepID=UPI0019FC110F|nr:hypothetical protein [Lutibacter sp.]NOR28352.1 hypothetical protein [Lutibacter sp.]
MPKDLRELLKNEPVQTRKLSKNHRINFEAKLQQELQTTKKNYNHILKIAASFLVVISLGSSLFYFSNNTVKNTNETAKIESLGSISPELKNIESYYLASINTEISSLQENSENKELLDGYLEKIGELTSEYKLLTKELNTEGLNEKTINALIDNLQLRLKLLYQLKEQLNELKKLNSTQNENLQV